MSKTYIVYCTDKLNIAITADYFEKYEDSIAFFNNMNGEKSRIAVFNLHNIIGVCEG